MDWPLLRPAKTARAVPGIALLHAGGHPAGAVGGGTDAVTFHFQRQVHHHADDAHLGGRIHHVNRHPARQQAGHGGGGDHMTFTRAHHIGQKGTGEGHVIATASMAGLLPGWVPVHVVYSAAKMGIIGMMMNLALEMKSHGVRTTTYCPGGVASGMKERKDRKSTRLNSSHVAISYAVFCL